MCVLNLFKLEALRVEVHFHEFAQNLYLKYNCRYEDRTFRPQAKFALTARIYILFEQEKQNVHHLLIFPTQRLKITPFQDFFVVNFCCN